MNRTKKFFLNSTTTVLLQVITMIAGFITPRVMLQYYGSEINGLVSSITQFISYFNIVEAGLSGAAVYALYKPLSENNHKAINGIVSAAKKFYTQAGYIFVSLTLGLALIYPNVIKTEALSPLFIGMLVLVLGVNGSLEFFTLSKYRAILTADQKTYVISIASILNIVINTIIIVILASFETNIVLLRLVALLSIFLRSIILITYVKLKYKYICYKETPNTAALERRWDVMYLQAMGVVRSGMPVIILTVVLQDLKLVSVYTIYNMVISGLSGILSVFISGLAASFGDVIVRKQMDTLRKTYNEFEFSYYSIITAIYAIACITIMPFIRIYTKGITDANYDVPIVGLLFVLNALLYNIHTPQAMLVQSAGMYKETRWQTTIQGVLVVLFGVIFGLFYGIEGVLMGAIISNIYRNIDLLFFTPRRITKTLVRTSFLRIIRILLCTTVICLPFLFIDARISSYCAWALYTAGVSIYAGIIVLLNGFLFDRNTMKNSIRRMLSIMKVQSE